MVIEDPTFSKMLTPADVASVLRVSSKTVLRLIASGDIAAVKVAMPKVYHDIASAAMHLHGALGVSNEMPFTQMLLGSMVMGIADGPTEVHKVTVAKQVLRDYRPDNDLFPSYHLPKLREAAEDRYPDIAAELKAQWETHAESIDAL